MNEDLQQSLVDRSVHKVAGKGAVGASLTGRSPTGNLSTEGCDAHPLMGSFRV